MTGPPFIERHRVLLADDDRACLRTLADFLAEEGFDVATAENGTVAIELLEAEPYSLVITDLNMPGATGLDVLSFVKRRNLAIPVIIITANTDEEAHEQARVMGASAYVTKPIQLDELLVRVQAQLS